MSHRQLSLQFDIDDGVRSVLRASGVWKERFAAADGESRLELARQLQQQVQQRLADVVHVLVFSGDLSAVADL
ncbi:hypothetical protein [Amycolatopsis australiensis]|uniref:Uncharacterized protein n=1 Tax=Amycolatopsis australiensis TaxID=546364 RepID=A0A1K1SVK4_9PSEU|nr:hypothetical protein [Amycolatopsis australiensis]SFW88361.1 hypothetical protein SAMN04489730_6937 [Amycolatopsis australiensis]